MLAHHGPPFAARPLSLIRPAFALVLLFHVAAFSAAAQGTSLELISVLPDTGTLYPGDVFFAQFKGACDQSASIRRGQNAGRIRRGELHCQRNVGRGARFHLKGREWRSQLGREQRGLEFAAA